MTTYELARNGGAGTRLTDEQGRAYQVSDWSPGAGMAFGWIMEGQPPLRGPYQPLPDGLVINAYRRGRCDYATIRDLASDQGQPSAIVTMDEYEEMLGCVPPIYFPGVHGFLVGEALTSDQRGIVYANYYISRDGVPCARYHCLEA